LSDPAIQATPALLPAAYLSPGISLAQLWAALRYYRWIILGSMFGCAFIAAVLSKLVLAKVYEASATLYVDFEVNDPASGRDFPQMLATSYMSTQKALIESPSVLLPVIDKLGWVGKPEFAKGYVAGRDGELRQYLMEKVLAEKLSVAPYKDSRLIGISWQGKNPAEVARAVNTIAETYAELHLKRSLEPAQARAREYSEQLESLRKAVDAAQAKVSEFRERSGLIDLDARVDVEAQSLLGLNQRRLQLEDESRSAALRRSEYERLRQASGAGEANIELLGNPYIQNLKTQLASQEARLAELSKTLGPRHPEYVAVATEIEALRTRLARESELFQNGVRGDAARASGGAAGVAEAAEAQRLRLLETRRLQEEGASLLRALEAAKTVYDRAVQGYETVLRSSATKYSNVSVVSIAPLPTKPIKPKAKVNVVLGFLAGGLLAMAGCLGWELLHRRIRCAEDMQGEMTEPVLAELGTLK
jgi:succinoglycan biosynthesis transport protein ExoP